MIRFAIIYVKKNCIQYTICPLGGKDVAAYKSVGENFKRLSKAYHWLTEQQLMEAVGYNKVYREDIDPLIRQNEEFTEAAVNKKYPFLRGRG